MPQLFADIPPSHPFFDYIFFTSVRQVMQGCAGGNFCPDTPITRAKNGAHHDSRAVWR